MNIKILAALRPGAQWSFDHSKSDLSGLTWFEGNTQTAPTQAEYDAEVAKLEGPPTPLEQIRAIEAPTADDFRKLTRQFLIAVLFKEAKIAAAANPATAHFTDAQIHDYLMTQGSGKGYAKLYLEEQAIIPLRELIP